MWKKTARQPVIFMSCHPSSSSDNKKINQKNSKHFIIALAGNANVGKSVIFNQRTGSNQIIGNWPRKTVNRAESPLRFKNYDVSVIDLPGIYSFSKFSLKANKMKKVTVT